MSDMLPIRMPPPRRRWKDLTLQDRYELLDEEPTDEGVTKNAERAGARSSGDTRNSSGRPRVVLRAASAIKSRLQRFLWQGRIPMGSVALLAGRGGVGKSSFAIWMLVEAQHGRLPGDLLGEEATVLYVSAEDDWATQMKPRLAAAGADMDRVFELAIGVTKDKVTGERFPSLPDDTPQIEAAIRQSGARLVILDPITSTISGDDHKRDVVRAVLDPLAKVARDTDVVILGIMHFNKGAGNASDKLSGSHAYRDAARAVLQFGADEQRGTIVMSQDKGNYAEVDAMSIEYRLVDTPVALDDGNVGHVPRVEIIGETHVSVSQLINRPVGGDEVVEWLRDFMASCGGRVAAKVGLDVAAQAGFSEGQINRAKERTRPKTISRKTAMDGGWEWLSEGVETSPEEIPENREEVVSVDSDAFAKPSRKVIRAVSARDSLAQ